MTSKKLKAELLDHFSGMSLDYIQTFLVEVLDDIAEECDDNIDRLGDDLKVAEDEEESNDLFDELREQRELANGIREIMEAIE